MSRPRGHIALAVAFVAGLGFATAYHRFRLGDTQHSPAADALEDTTMEAGDQPARRNDPTEAPSIQTAPAGARGGPSTFRAAEPRNTSAIETAGRAAASNDHGLRPQRGPLSRADNRSDSVADLELGRLYGRIAETSLFLPSCWSADVAKPHAAALQRGDASSDDGHLVVVSDPAMRADGTTSRVWQTIIPEPLRGERIAVRAQLRSSGVRDRAFMWVTANDANGNSLAYDGMDYSFMQLGARREIQLTPVPRVLTGDREWATHEIVLDVPIETYSLSYGVTIVGDGALWTDDVSIVIVDSTVPVTGHGGLLRAPTLPLPISELTLRAPFNTDFELGGFLNASACIELAAASR